MWNQKSGAIKIILVLTVHAVQASVAPLLALRLPLQRLGSMYVSMLAKNPLATHCVQGAAISGVSADTRTAAHACCLHVYLHLLMSTCVHMRSTKICICICTSLGLSVSGG
jgi:hypothetical protein